MQRATITITAGMAVTSSAAIAPSSSLRRLLDRERTANHFGENPPHFVAAENHHQETGERYSCHRCDDIFSRCRPLIIGQSFPHGFSLVVCVTGGGCRRRPVCASDGAAVGRKGGNVEKIRLCSMDSGTVDRNSGEGRRVGDHTARRPRAGVVVRARPQVPEDGIISIKGQ